MKVFNAFDVNRAVIFLINFRENSLVLNLKKLPKILDKMLMMMILKICFIELI